MTGFNAKTGELLLTKPNPSKEAVWEVCGYVQRRGSAAGRGSWAELNHPGAAGWDWLGKESITGMMSGRENHEGGCTEMDWKDGRRGYC